jgi:hypothetical protein
MVHGDRDDPLWTELDAFGPFFTQLSFFPQVTTGCDHVLIPKALSAFANGGGANPCFLKSR